MIESIKSTGREMLRYLLPFLLVASQAAFAQGYVPDALWREVWHTERFTAMPVEFSFEVINNTAHRVVGIYAVPAVPGERSDFTESWGPNLFHVILPRCRSAYTKSDLNCRRELTRSYLLPDETSWFRGLGWFQGFDQLERRGVCNLRLRIVYDNDTVEERVGLNGCAVDERVVLRPGWTLEGAALSPSAALAEHFQLINRSGAEIWGVYVRRDGAGAGRNRLGSRRLASGSQISISLAGLNPRHDCGHTITLVYSPYAEVGRLLQTRSGINLCAVRNVVIDDNWTTTDNLRASGTIRNGTTDYYIRRLRVALRGMKYGHGLKHVQEPDVMLLPGGSIAVPRPGRTACLYRMTAVLTAYGLKNRETSVDVDLCSRQEIMVR